MEKIQIIIEPTPNPNALKFVLNSPVKNQGKATYRTAQETSENPMAQALFTIRGVDQLHFYDNVITISKHPYEEWEALESNVMDCIRQKMPTHDPNFQSSETEEENQVELTPELEKINEILDRTVRPYLQGDGGDLTPLSYEDHILLIKYQGACGSCPSALTGTLQAIRNVLQNEFDPNIEVYSVPE